MKKQLGLQSTGRRVLGLTRCTSGNSLCPSANTRVALADPRVTDGGGWLGIGKVFVEVGIVICIGVKRVALVNGREGVVERVSRSGRGVGVETVLRAIRGATVLDGRQRGWRRMKGKRRSYHFDAASTGQAPVQVDCVHSRLGERAGSEEGAVVVVGRGGGGKGRRKRKGRLWDDYMQPGVRPTRSAPLGQIAPRSGGRLNYFLWHLGLAPVTEGHSESQRGGECSRPLGEIVMRSCQVSGILASRTPPSYPLPPSESPPPPTLRSACPYSVHTLPTPRNQP